MSVRDKQSVERSVCDSSVFYSPRAPWKKISIVRVLSELDNVKQDVPVSSREE